MTKTVSDAAEAARITAFIDAFRSAIGKEMEAMRDRMGPSEVPLAGGESEPPPEGSPRRRVSYGLAGSAAKLVAGMECSLRAGDRELPVRIDAIEGGRAVLSAERDIPVLEAGAALVVYPWFLYERLLEALRAVGEGRHPARMALKLFDKVPAEIKSGDLLGEHDELNASQERAVRLCAGSEIAFVWGPPGTGKTTTLANIVEELTAQKKSVLVLSTTNAALDQALARIAGRPGLAGRLKDGRVIRIGRSEGERFGTSLREAAERLLSRDGEDVSALRRKYDWAGETLERCARARAALFDHLGPAQRSLFEEVERRLPLDWDLNGIFPAWKAPLILKEPVELQLELVDHRRRRLKQLRQAVKGRLTRRQGGVLKKEIELMNGADVVLATLANAYFSPHMKGLRFDAVVVDEASMAVLPNLFYAACLARKRVIMVGDPRQLPPITQSEDPFVQKVMGRNIFDVAVPDPLVSPRVCMLDRQYRMHPEIGKLVSEAFYSGRLHHGGPLGPQKAIAALRPFPGRAVILLDTKGRFRCEQGPTGRSRRNPDSAALAVDLAREAVEAGAGSVAVVTPYADQSRTLRDLLGPDLRDKVECCTVHRFQGREKDVVIIDTVDAEPMRPGVLLAGRADPTAAASLINVAISRARGKLIIIADLAYFQNRAFGTVITKTLERALLTGRRVDLGSLNARGS